MKPEEFLKKTTSYLNNLEKAKRLKVKVGLPSEKIGGKVYGDGTSILQVGIWHEYGRGNNPMRSFIRAPFIVKREEMNAYVAIQFNNVFENGTDAEVALSRVGVKGMNICKGAFRERGYGEWKDLSDATKKAKGSDAPLVDTGVLRNSITWSLEG